MPDPRGWPGFDRPRGYGHVRDRSPYELEILDRFRLRSATDDVDIPPRSAMVLAYLAIRDRPVRRSVIADALWPELTERRALASLRSAIYRLHAPAPGPIVRATGESLELVPWLRVDLRDAIILARDLATTPRLPSSVERVVGVLARELLPDWEQDWIEPEREHFRQLRLRALDALAERLIAAGRHAEAVEVAQAALAVEPLSETAERALIEAFMDEGNEALAVREYETFRRRLWRDLRLRPSADLDQVRPKTRAPR
jgi:DNA-binding SARP family transcriptional activator